MMRESAQLKRKKTEKNQTTGGGVKAKGQHRLTTGSYANISIAIE